MSLAEVLDKPLNRLSIFQLKVSLMFCIHIIATTKSLYGMRKCTSITSPTKTLYMQSLSRMAWQEPASLVCYDLIHLPGLYST